MSELRNILKDFEKGELDIEGTIRKLRSGMFEDIGHSRVDHDRLERNGKAEVIFGEGKTVDQIDGIMGSLRKRGQDVLVTRLSAEKAGQLLQKHPEAVYHESARVLTIRETAPASTDSWIAVVCAGTSDLPVAEEARITAEFYGNRVKPVYDAGVAGLHRLIADLDTLREAKVVVAVAGMEGALPSVVAGLVKAPVIAVPTSVGYGASFGGVAALLAMLNSCASGLSVVNIDNGFGAGYLASMINRIGTEA
ncbi:MAG: nickel pincer cofactor biosynthesis protein LarB [Opitutales bacterium]|jgi:NCAIR mutase (PurE)-related protein